MPQCQHCKKEYKHSPSLSKHKKTCRETILAELQEKTQLDDKMSAAEINNTKAKMNNLDLLNTDYGDVPDVVSWGNGLKFTLHDVENVIMSGSKEFLTCLKKYIDETPPKMRPIKIINQQSTSQRFKMFMREIENGVPVWKQYIGDKGFETFVRFTTYKLGNRMRMVKYIGEWIKEHPNYEIDYSKDEQQYRDLRSCFGYSYDDKVAPAYASEIINYFTFKKAIAEEDDE